MFKKGVITDEISQNLEEAVELAKRFDLDGVEIRSIWEKSPHEFDRDDIGKIKKLVTGAGLEVCGISSPFFKCNIDKPEEVEQNMKILEKCITLADELGTKLVRGFTFWKSGDFNENLPRIISMYEKPIKMLEKAGVTLVLELDPSVFATNAAKLAKVVSGVGANCVKALWDPGNDIYDPDGEVPYPNGYDVLKPYIAHVHLKDAKKGPDGKPMGTPIGKGEVDFKGQFKALLKDGYNGYVVLETHYRPKHEMSEGLLALPKGSAFSYLGYEATEESLGLWKAMMDEILK